VCRCPALTATDAVRAYARRNRLVFEPDAVWRIDLAQIATRKLAIALVSVARPILDRDVGPEN
jgi:hypothetical protein